LKSRVCKFLWNALTGGGGWEWSRMGRGGMRIMRRMATRRTVMPSVTSRKGAGECVLEGLYSQLNGPLENYIFQHKPDLGTHAVPTPAWVQSLNNKHW
jgi:hypothetical protein